MAIRMAIIFLVIAVFAAAAPAALSNTLDEAGQPNLIGNETWTPNAGSVTQLEYSNLDNAGYDPQVYVADSNGNQVFEPDDYIWFESNGTIKTVVGGKLDGETSAEISYEYDRSTEEQRQWASMLSQIPNVMGLALPIFALLFALMVVRG